MLLRPLTFSSPDFVDICACLFPTIPSLFPFPPSELLSPPGCHTLQTSHSVKAYPVKSEGSFFLCLSVPAPSYLLCLPHTSLSLFGQQSFTCRGSSSLPTLFLGLHTPGIRQPLPCFHGLRYFPPDFRTQLSHHLPFCGKPSLND